MKKKFCYCLRYILLLSNIFCLYSKSFSQTSIYWHINNLPVPVYSDFPQCFPVGPGAHFRASVYASIDSLRLPGIPLSNNVLPSLGIKQLGNSWTAPYNASNYGISTSTGGISYGPNDSVVYYVIRTGAVLNNDPTETFASPGCYHDIIYKIYVHQLCSNYYNVRSFLYPPSLNDDGVDAYIMPSFSESLVISDPNISYCPNDSIRFSITRDYIDTYNNSSNYQYQYQLPNSNTWVNLTLGNITSFNTPQLVFTPSMDAGLNALTSNSAVAFRVIINRSCGNTIVSANTVTINLSPTIKVQSVTSSPSCPNSSGGSINISGVSGGNDTYRYILRNGLNNTDPCDPANGTCFNVQTTGSFTGSNYTITGIPAGDYTLWIANSGGNVGACSSTYNISIDQIGLLGKESLLTQNISCPGGSNGQINIVGTGGLSPYSFALTSTGGTINNTTGQFNNLSAGSYTLKLTDGCNQSIQNNITLTQPTPVNISAGSSNATCNNPADGGINVTASGGSGNYNYYLYDANNNLISQQLNTTNTNWNAGSLSPGNYTIKAGDVATIPAGCSLTTQVVTITAPPALVLNLTNQTNNVCYGNTSGTLQFSAGGGQNAGYIFYLKDNNSGQIYTSAIGSFANLPSSAYTAWVRNNDAGCLDSTLYSSTIIITSPPALTATATSNNVVCYNRQNGVLQSSVSGGASNYTYKWYAWDSEAGWLPQNALTGPSANGVDTGTYRMKVIDQNGCTAYSNSVTITQPDSLAITSVKVQDIVCYGDNGFIQMNAAGGNGGLMYESSVAGGTWNSFNNATAFSAGTYRVRVKDNQGCVTYYTPALSITAPSSPLNLGYTLSDYNGYNVSCYGGNNGYIKYSASGGNGGNYSGYSFAVDGGTYSLNDSLNSTAGTHTISVKDARGCVVSQPVTLTQPVTKMLLSLVTQQNNICSYDTTGQIMVSASNGVPDYLYSDDGGKTYQSSSQFTQLSSGIYKVYVQDANKCMDSLPVTITNLYPAITNTINVNSVKCYEGNDGSISLNPQGGAGNFHIIWNDTLVGTASLTGLKAGIYHALITDVAGCKSATGNIQITQPAKALAFTSAQSTNAVCYGDSGMIAATATGGTGAYNFSYSLNGGNYVSFVPGITSLPAGDYNIKVTDANSCVTQYPNILAVTQPAKALDFAYDLSNYNGYNISCYGSPTGNITVVPAGGNGSTYYGYYFSLDGSREIFYDTALQNNIVFGSLTAGSHTLQLSDGRGCAVNKNIVLTQPGAPLQSQSSYIIHNNCAGGGAGSFTLQASGGALPYTYSIDSGVTYLSSSVFTQLKSKTYHTVVKDANGCVQNTDVVIRDLNSPVQVHSSTQNILCNGNSTGSISLNVSGGVQPYIYNWLNNAAVSSNTANNLPAGNYSVAVQDNAGCRTDTFSFTLTQPPALIIQSVTAPDAACYNDSVPVTINAAGGNGAYMYSYARQSAGNWNSFNNAGTASSSTLLPAGNYLFKVTDANGCTNQYNNTLQITNPPSPLQMDYVVSDYNGFGVTCFGNTNGCITATASGGNGGSYSGYSFTLDNNSFAANNSFPNLSARTYHLKVKDGRGCIITQPVTLTQPASFMQLQATQTMDNICAGGSRGGLTLSGSNGAEPYTYSIDSGRSFQSSPAFGNLYSNAYICEVKDANGCRQIAGFNVVDINQPIQPVPAISPVKCYGGSDGGITLNPTGGVAPYTYLWLDDFTTGKSINNLTTGNYSVTITDSKNCSVIKTFAVTQPAASVSASIYTKPVCVNNANGVIAFTAQGGTLPYLYSVDDGSTYQADPVFANHLPAGNYRLQVKDNNGCLWNGNTIVTTNNQNPAVNFLVTTSQNALDTLQVLDVSVPKPDSINWTFDPKTIIISNNMFSPLIKYNGQGGYPVTMQAWYGGCDFINNRIIVINPYDPDVTNSYSNNIGIDTVIVYPNPNKGTFTLQVNLFMKQKLLVNIYSSAGQLLWAKQWDGVNSIKEPVTLPVNVSMGTVFIKVLTNNDARDVQILITK